MSTIALEQPVRYAMDRESQRLEFIVERDGEDAARAWAQRTLEIYRNAVDNPHSHASGAQYRGLFLAAIRDIEAWLQAHPPA